MLNYEDFYYVHVNREDDPVITDSQLAVTSQRTSQRFTVKVRTCAQAILDGMAYIFFPCAGEFGYIVGHDLLVVDDVEHSNGRALRSRLFCVVQSDCLACPAWRPAYPTLGLLQVPVQFQLGASPK